MASLAIENVWKKYGDVIALRDINLDIQDGEFIVLVGPSGCGKSTLLSMIAGLEDTSYGNLKLGEREVTDLQPKDRDIAMVFQSYALYPTMTVRQNITFGMENRKIDKASQQKAVDDVASLLQIDPLLDRKPSQLSGGQRQRVAMGRALVRDPALFLFDEPLSNLDAKLRVEMRTEIKKLHKRLGQTIVYVTHDQVEAMTLSDRIVVMKGGVVQQFADPDTVYTEPANMFVAGFMGSPSMNFINMQVEGEPGNLTLRQIGSSDNPLRVPLADRHPELDGYVGNEVVFGVRPEHFSLPDAAEEESVLVNVNIDVVEPTGPDVMIVAMVAGKELVATLPPAFRPEEGSVAHLAINLSKVCFFNPDTTERIVPVELSK